MADSHLLAGMFPQNTSGRPNAGSLAAIRRHRSQAGAGPSSSRAAVCWSPLSEFSVSEPIVVRTRSSSPRSVPPACPSSVQWMRVASLRPGVRSKSMSVTSVAKRNVTPWSISQRVSGRTIDSYWLYLVNFSAERSGSPPTWWTKRCRYSFISSAPCHSSKANMVRQYSQKLLSRKSRPNTSSIRLPSSSSRVARKIFTRSFWARSFRANRPSVPASCPWRSVTRCKE